MEALGFSQAVWSQARKPRQWLAAYFRHRAHLAAHGSDFRCDPACTRPGCKNRDLQVPVSLLDLLGAAHHRHESVAAIYQNACSVGLLANGREDWLRTVSLRLKKPCPFLVEDLCSIYPVRPLPCILFPEDLVAAGTLEDTARQAHFRDFLCLRRPIPLSPQRRKVIAYLRQLWRRESLIASFALFGHSPCVVDFSNLAGQLLEETHRGREALSPARPAGAQIIPPEIVEQFFWRHFMRHPPFAGISDKIGQLDNQEGQEALLLLFRDDVFLEKLKRGGDGRAVVFFLAQGQLRAKRRSLSPPEHKFY